MKQKGKMSGKKLKQMFVTYTFVLPDFIGLLVFIIIPIIYSSVSYTHLALPTNSLV